MASPLPSSPRCRGDVRSQRSAEGSPVRQPVARAFEQGCRTPAGSAVPRTWSPNSRPPEQNISTSHLSPSLPSVVLRDLPKAGGGNCDTPAPFAHDTLTSQLRDITQRTQDIRLDDLATDSPAVAAITMRNPRQTNSNVTVDYEPVRGTSRHFQKARLQEALAFDCLRSVPGIHNVVADSRGPESLKPQHAAAVVGNESVAESMMPSVELASSAIVDGERWSLLKIEVPEHHTTMRTDLHLVLDISGSMQGSRHKELVRCVEFALDRLDEGDRVSCTCFESHALCLASLRYCTAEHKQSLVAKLRKLRCAGGTSISSGMTEAFARLPVESHPNCQVVLISDGQSQETSAPIAQNCVVNSIGLGSASTVKLQQIADRGQGQYQYATEENLEHAVALIMSNAITTSHINVVLKKFDNTGIGKGNSMEKLAALCLGETRTCLVKNATAALITWTNAVDHQQRDCRLDIPQVDKDPGAVTRKVALKMALDALKSERLDTCDQMLEKLAPFRRDDAATDDAHEQISQAVFRSRSREAGSRQFTASVYSSQVAQKPSTTSQRGLKQPFLTNTSRSFSAKVTGKSSKPHAGRNSAGMNTTTAVRRRDGLPDVLDIVPSHCHQSGFPSSAGPDHHHHHHQPAMPQGHITHRLQRPAAVPRPRLLSRFADTPPYQDDHRNQHAEVSSTVAPTCPRSPSFSGWQGETLRDSEASQ